LGFGFCPPFLHFRGGDISSSMAAMTLAPEGN